MLLLAACADGEATPVPPPATTLPVMLLNVGISDNATRLAEKWGLAYDEVSELASVNFVAGNNTTLFNDLDAARLDAILVHHIPEGGQARWFNPVALDGLVIIVNSENPVTSLTQAQVQSLFSGETGNWSAVGGPDLTVAPVAQERGDGARTVFMRRIMGARPVSINTVIQSGSGGLLAAVASERGAIGYTMLSALEATPDSAVRAVAIDGIAPTPESCASQEYPLTVPLYFVSPEEPQSELRAFLAWLQSDEGQAIVSETVGSVR